MLLSFAGRESATALGLCALLLWAPLPAGGVTPAGQLGLRLAACALFVLAADRSLLAARGRAAVACLAAVAVLGLVQWCPWPAAVARLVSPEHARLAAQAAELVGAGAPSWVPLSLDARATGSAALSWLGAALLLAAVLVGGRRTAHRRWLLAALLGSALIQLGLGLVALEVSSPGGLTAVLLRPEGRLRGTYANPNHLSLLLEIAMAVAAAWSWMELSRRRRGGGTWSRLLVSLVVWMTLLAGVVLTGSRAGLAAALVGVAVQLAVVVLASGRRRATAVVVILVALGLGTVALGGADLGIRRYETVSLYESNLRSRLLLTLPALELWRRFAVTGTGLGTFQEAFPLEAPPELGTVIWNRAHNDPLELLVTGGVVGFALGLAAVVALLRPIWRRLRDAPGLEDRAAGLAAAGALAAAGLHELFDFGLVIPANALALLVVLGSAAAVGPAGVGRANPSPGAAPE